MPISLPINWFVSPKGRMGTCVFESMLGNKNSQEKSKLPILTTPLANLAKTLLHKCYDSFKKGQLCFLVEIMPLGVSLRSLPGQPKYQLIAKGLAQFSYDSLNKRHLSIEVWGSWNLF